MKSAIDILKRDRQTILLNLQHNPNEKPSLIKEQCRTVLELNDAIDCLECKRLMNEVEKNLS